MWGEGLDQWDGAQMHEVREFAGYADLSITGKLPLNKKTGRTSCTDLLGLCSHHSVIRISAYPANSGTFCTWTR